MYIYFIKTLSKIFKTERKICYSQIIVCVLRSHRLFEKKILRILNCLF